MPVCLYAYLTLLYLPTRQVRLLIAMLRRVESRGDERLTEETLHRGNNRHHTAENPRRVIMPNCQQRQWMEMTDAPIAGDDDTKRSGRYIENPFLRA